MAKTGSRITICSRCVMNTSDPQLSFDADGVCNHCRDYESRVAVRLGRGGASQSEKAFHALVARIKADGRGRPYDCIVGVSGGVDSTYVAHLARRAGLRCLAVHFDNGWNSDTAVRNIEAMLARLQIDLYTYVVDWPEFRDLQTAFLKASTPDGEIPTDHGIFAVLMRLANQHGIKYVMSGMNFASEGAKVPDWAYGHSDWTYIRGVHRRFGSVRLKSYPHFSLLYLAVTMARRIRFVSPLNYVRYDRATALEELRSDLGYEDYGGKHYESVYTRFFQGYVLPTKFKIDKRRLHLSRRIQSGNLTRTEALELLKQPVYPEALLQQDYDFAVKKLAMTVAEFEAIMRLPPRRYTDFPNRARMIGGLKHLQDWLRGRGLLHR